MKVTNVFEAKGFFHVLATSEGSQTAVMRLAPGKESSRHANAHPHSDQVLFVFEGEVVGEVAGERRALRRGDSVIVPAGTPHRFFNEGQTEAVTFNVYAPPAYGKGD